MSLSINLGSTTVELEELTFLFIAIDSKDTIKINPTIITRVIIKVVIRSTRRPGGSVAAFSLLE